MSCRTLAHFQSGGMVDAANQPFGANRRAVERSNIEAVSKPPPNSLPASARCPAPATFILQDIDHPCASTSIVNAPRHCLDQREVVNNVITALTRTR
jgi:hypothetical protein